MIKPCGWRCFIFKSDSTLNFIPFIKNDPITAATNLMGSNPEDNFIQIRKCLHRLLFPPRKLIRFSGSIKMQRGCAVLGRAFAENV
jgi:hypothetical protein